LLGERVIEGGTLTPQAEHAKLHQAEICTFLSFLAVPGTCLAVVWGHEARESGEVSVELWPFFCDVFVAYQKCLADGRPPSTTSHIPP